MADAPLMAACGCEGAYFCPTSSDVECPNHGGFDVCCDQTHLHTTPDNLRKRDHPELCCPTCPEGRLVAGEKHLDPSKPAWRRFDCGHFVDDRARMNALLTVDMSQRYADAISAVLDKPNGIAYRGTLPAALLAVRDEELERLRALVAHYENTINWHTTCHNCAAILDSSIKDTERAEKAEASNARVAALHPSREEADVAETSLCPECIAPVPCKTRRALDGED
jgi:hypothetical protein